MSDDKILSTLEALARGEKPPCPWCGAKWIGGPEYAWECGSYAAMRDGIPFGISISGTCYERQLAALREKVTQLAIENSRLECEARSDLLRIREGEQAGRDLINSLKDLATLRAENEREKTIRIKYQDIVYSICHLFDVHGHLPQGTETLVDTVKFLKGEVDLHKAKIQTLATTLEERTTHLSVLEEENKELQNEGDWRVRADYEALKDRYEELRDKFNLLKADIRNALNESKSEGAERGKEKDA
jgi:hypothetical protein